VARSARLARLTWALAALAMAAALACVLWFVVRTTAARVPYWGEAEVLFEARRLRDGLPLFVDPWKGAADMGQPPSRWYVTYPPIWSWVVSLAPAGAALVASRVASVLAWLGALGVTAATSKRACRANALAAAAFVAGTWILVNFAAVARPDSVACALACAGLVRALRRGRIDALSAVLLALAPWVKPTIIGLPAGAFAADLVVRRRAALPAIGAGLATLLAIGALLEAASGGALLSNVVLSNAQPMTLAAWLEHVPSRLPFFAPLLALAGCTAWRARRTPGVAIGLGALAASTAWVLVALAKTGSASNYWMEPCVASVALLAYAAPGAGGYRFGASGPIAAAATLGAALWVDVASVRASLEHAREYRDEAAFVATLARRCGGVVAADEAGIELAADGRVLTPTYQMVHLVRAGRYSASLWAADLRRAACVVEHTGQYRLSPELSRALDEGFVREPDAASGFRLLRPKRRE
jgi:hypothetical protein